MGIDFSVDIGTIYAAASGVVADAGWGTGYGLRTKIDHDHLGDYSTLYAHLSRSYVKTGDVVRQGQLIGLVGNTGRSTGPHLHYELHKGQRQIDPVEKVSRKHLFRTIDAGLRRISRQCRSCVICPSYRRSCRCQWVVGLSPTRAVSMSSFGRDVVLIVSHLGLHCFCRHVAVSRARAVRFDGAC